MTLALTSTPASQTAKRRAPSPPSLRRPGPGHEGQPEAAPAESGPRLGVVEAARQSLPSPPRSPRSPCPTLSLGLPLSKRMGRRTLPAYLPRPRPRPGMAQRGRGWRCRGAAPGLAAQARLPGAAVSEFLVSDAASAGPSPGHREAPERAWRSLRLRLQSAPSRGSRLPPDADVSLPAGSARALNPQPPPRVAPPPHCLSHPRSLISSPFRQSSPMKITRMVAFLRPFSK